MWIKMRKDRKYLFSPTLYGHNQWTIALEWIISIYLKLESWSKWRVGVQLQSLQTCKLHTLGVAEWIARSLVNPAAWDWISLLLKVSIHCCLLSAACIRDVCMVGLLYYMLIQCAPLLVKKAGVAPDMTLGFIKCKQVSVQVREPP